MTGQQINPDRQADNKGLSGIFNRLMPRGSALRNSSFLLSSTMLSQAVTIAAMPLLSRIYTPADFGIFAVFISFVTICNEFFGLRYHFGICLPKQQRFADALFMLSFWLQSAAALVLTGLLFFLKDPFLRCLSCKELIPYWYLIPLASFSASLFVLMVQWSTRMKAFGTVSKANVNNSFWAAAVKGCASFIAYSPVGLCAGFIAGRVSGICVLAYKNIKAYGLPSASFRDMRKVALKYRKYPLFSMPGGIFNPMSLQIVPILMLNFYSAKIAGLFSIAMKLIQLPSAIAGQALGQVFLQKGSQVKHDGKLGEVVKKIYISLVYTGVFPILLISVYAPWIFSLFLGEKWATAGLYTSLLGPGIVLAFCFNPISRVFSILNLQDRFLFFQIINNFLKVIAILAGVYLFKSPLYSIGLFSAANLVFSLYVTLWVFKKTGLVFSDIKQIMIVPVIKSLVVLSPNLLAAYMTESIWIKAVSGLMTSIIYAGLVYREFKAVHYGE